MGRQTRVPLQKRTNVTISLFNTVENRCYRLKDPQKRPQKSHLFWFCYCATCLALRKLVTLEASQLQKEQGITAHIGKLRLQEAVASQDHKDGSKPDPGELDPVSLTFCAGGRGRSSATEVAFHLEALPTTPSSYTLTFYPPWSIRALVGC